ncbi:MAG: tyrosine-type recombinase/integrase [Armatimonadota bacterium]|nr:MAG: tyrosine-type recombinase/integrase [Armatimonadota bacterium]
MGRVADAGTSLRSEGGRKSRASLRAFQADFTDARQRPLVTPHRLRHYFGLTSAMAGVPTTALMRALGHRTPIMTARYSEFADAERRWAFARADITNGIRLSRPQRDETAEADGTVARR